MKTTTARALTYTVVGALALAALRYIRPLPESPAPLAALATEQPAPPAYSEKSDTLDRGETLGALLGRVGLRGADAVMALRAIPALDERRVPVGLAVVARTAPSDSMPSEITFQLAIDRLLHVRRTADSGWVGTEERLPWTVDTVVVGGVIHSTLYEALDSAAAGVLPPAQRAELAWELADIYEYRLDMSRDLQEDDRFRILFERATGPGGAVRIDHILAADFVNSGNTIEAIRYESPTIHGQYYDQDGRSMRAAFLRAPVAFRRIASVFGMRKHPILGIWRAHKGTDYAAASGTPVRAIGDGVVIRAGVYRGYGNCLEIRHANGFVSRYGHLSRFAKGTRVGARVGIGQTVAYVGMTGLATGPHLHFEVLVNGAQRDPRVALRQKGGLPLPTAERAAFLRHRELVVARLEGPPGPVRLASRD